MATNVGPPYDPFAGLLPGMKAFSEGIDEMLQPKFQKEDVALLTQTLASAGDDPAKRAQVLSDLAPKFKSKAFQENANRLILQNALQSTQTRDVYQQQGKKLVKTGDKIPANAEIMKADPADLEAQREAGRERLESQKEAGREKVEDSRFKQQNAVEGFRFERQMGQQQHQLDMQRNLFSQQQTLAELKQKGADAKEFQESGRKAATEYEKMR